MAAGASLSVEQGMPNSSLHYWKRQRVPIAAAVLCATAAWFLWPAGQPITVETYQRLRLGTTRDEVEDLLGRPGRPRDDFIRWLLVNRQWVKNHSPTIGPGNDLLNEHRNQPGIEYWYRDYWYRDRGVITLQYDPDDRVAHKGYIWIYVTPYPQWLIRVLRRLGW